MQQSDGYARAVAHMGATTQTVFAIDDGAAIARLQVILRRFGPLNIAWLPRGPVWAPGTTPRQQAQVLNRLSTALPERATWVVTPDSMQDCQLFRHTPLMSPQHVAELDLSTDPDSRLAVQHGKWRNRLRHAQSSDLRLTHRPFKIERDSEVLTHEALQRQHRGYSALPAAFVTAWAKQNPKDSRLFTIWRGNQALAYLLVLLHKPVATYHIGWSGSEGRHYSAHNLGLWEAANWLTRKGFLRFDLGSVDTQNAPGLARFKIGSGAHVRPLGPTCLYLPQLSFRRSARHAAA